MKERSKPRASGPRRLTLAELRLWRTVTQGVARRWDAAPLPEFADGLNEESAQPQPVSRVGSPAAVPNKPAAAPPLAPLEARLRQRLARGHVEVEDVLDLHGFRQAEAHRVLRSFLIGAQSRGAKLVLVVTGKGRTATEPGILRRAVPLWLEAVDMRSVVIGFGEATATHGGSGALYVRLRRKERVRKPGP
ncbi:MAG: Smr/MutS family protein [Beijerinckiaceae bacterium]